MNNKFDCLFDVTYEVFMIHAGRMGIIMSENIG